MPDLKTKKAALESGLKPEQKLSVFVVPKRDAQPVFVKGEAFYAEDQTERLISVSEAKRMGLKVPDGVDPVRMLNGKHCLYSAYRTSDCIPRRKTVSVPAKRIDLLQAIFCVNRSAKRHRDAAQKQYRSGTHGFAGNSRQTKEYLYKLKDGGIAEGVRQRRLEFAGTNGNLALYRGEGYSFHSTLLPICEKTPDVSQEVVFIESKPKDSREARLKDAIYTLGGLPEVTDRFTRLERPTFPKSEPIPRRSHLIDDDEDDEGNEEWTE